MEYKKIDGKYYNGSKLLECMDINGDLPGIYLSNSNRSAGKTTYYLLRSLENFLIKGDQFILINRKKNELDSPETLFENILDMYYPDVLMHSKWYVNRLIKGIYVDNKIAGFSICLKDAVALKKYSTIYTKVTTGIMDEMQPEDGRYLKGEVELFQSIIKTVSRGGGKQSRYLRWILLSNNISVMNPYFINLGIYEKISDKMNLKEGEDFYLKGSGWVCEFTFNANAKAEMMDNPAINAFNSRNSVLGLSADFMISSGGFIEKKMKGKMDYLFTIKYKGERIGVRQVKSSNIVYITSSYDPSFKTVVALSDNDHEDITIMLRRNTFYMQVLRDSYGVGKMRFSDIKVKDMMLELLGIDYYRD